MKETMNREKERQEKIYIGKQQKKAYEDMVARKRKQLRKLREQEEALKGN